jgi:hypothetical protein
MITTVSIRKQRCRTGVEGDRVRLKGTQGLRAGHHDHAPAAPTAPGLGDREHYHDTDTSLVMCTCRYRLLGLLATRRNSSQTCSTS